jgi:hypothetical protein
VKGTQKRREIAGRQKDNISFTGYFIPGEKAPVPII